MTRLSDGYGFKIRFVTLNSPLRIGRSQTGRHMGVVSQDQISPQGFQVNLR